MGVSSTTNRQLYAGDGSSVAFAFAYYFFATTDLVVKKYDTILGGVTSLVLNTDYTMSGTPDLQGRYPNGGTVTTTTAPLSTDILVIYRDCPEVNNYSLSQNGAISAVAIVQQFDYLTLLIQRLEDQAARAMSVPDGMGLTFSNQLPANIALLPGQSPVVNASGNGWTLTTLGNPFKWQSVVIPYTALQTAATSQKVTLFSLPAGWGIFGLNIKNTTAFAGTSITDVVANIGTTADPTKFIDGFDVLAAVSDSNFEMNMTNTLLSFASATDIKLQGVATGANLSALSQGSITVNYLIMDVA